MLNPKIFREQDICGIADSDLPDNKVEVLGKALASYLIRYSGRIICVGRDARESSPRLHAALVTGLTRAGARVLDIAVVPTPVLYYSAFHFTADAAIMVTGGNDTLEHNGFKIVCGPSLLVGQAFDDIHKLIRIADFEVGEGAVEPADAITPYLEELASQFQSLRGVKVTLDAGSETSRLLLEQLLKTLKASVVKKGGVAVRISLSADADCITVLDENGIAVSPDKLLLLFAREILTRKPESVLLCDERFPDAILRKLIELGGQPIAISASEPSVQSRIKRERAELSVLASGEIAFADRFYGFNDAIYAACRLLEIIAISEEPLSAELTCLEADNRLPAPSS